MTVTNEPVTHTVTILDLSNFQIQSVDQSVKFIDLNSTIV